MKKCKKNKTYLKFDCGARLPEKGFLPEPYRPHAEKINSKPRKKDGRVRLIVFDTGQSDYLRPIMPDGKCAPCLACPCKRSSGMKQERCMPEDGKSSFRFIIMCYPDELGTPLTENGS